MIDYAFGMFQGDSADCMYFVEDGDVKIMISPKVFKCHLVSRYVIHYSSMY